MIDMQTFLSKFKGVKQVRGGYMVQCPCHDDKTASLSIGMGEKGIVLHCMAGCDSSDIVRALGLTWRDLCTDEMQREWQAAHPAGAAKTQQKAQKSTKPAAEITTKPPKKIPADLNRLKIWGTYAQKDAPPETITAMYEYTDADGAPLLRVYRTDKKSFPTIHCDGGKWFWGDGGRHNVLYHLPEVVKAVQDGKKVLIVEGEKDVETLRTLGYAATTNKGGAGKWSEELSKHFKGADVVIIPDMDEPGEKHAKLILHELRNDAKSIRIVNLRRQKATPLPPKGDISDLAGALGAEKAKGVLENLIALSPVLARNIGGGDYEDYFVGISGCHVRSGCIFSPTAEGDERPLSNFVALPVEQVSIDDGEGQLRQEFVIEGWSSTGMKLKALRVPAESFAKMNWAIEGWGLNAVIYEGNGVAQKLRRIIQSAGVAAAIQRTMYSHTGWREIDGKVCFLHGGGAISAAGDVEADVQLDFRLGRYRLDGLREGEWLETMGREKALPLCQSATLRLMDVATLRVGVPLVGYLFLSPLTHFLRKVGRKPSVVPFVRGTTGMGKTSIVTLAMNHFGYDFRFEGDQPGSFNDSIASMERKLFILKDLPLLVDDYKTVADARQMSARRALEENIIRMVCDGLKRSRISADMTAQHDYPARGLCIQTGEELPSETGDSNIARLYVINLAAGNVPLPTSDAAPERKAEMQELWRLAKEGALNESMRGYIAYLAGQADKLPARLDALYREMFDEASRRVSGTHARLPSAVAYIMLGVRMMVEYMAQPGGVLDGVTDFEEVMRPYWDAVSANSQEQREAMTSQAPTQVFLATMRELLMSGKNVVLDMGIANQPTTPPIGMIGYRDAEKYYFIPGAAYGAVCESLRVQGATMAVGKTTLLRQLAEEGISQRSTKGETLQQIRRGGVHGRYLVVARSILDDEKTPEQAKTLAKGHQLGMEEIDEMPDNPF